jgi:hypothetical protein
MNQRAAGGRNDLDHVSLKATWRARIVKLATDEGIKKRRYLIMTILPSHDVTITCLWTYIFDEKPVYTVHQNNAKT